VSFSLGQRLLALTAAGLLAGVIAVAVAEQNADSARASGPQPAVGQGASWSQAVAGVARPYPVRGRRSSCGWLLRTGTLGVVHPVLPCGTKVFVELEGKRVYTQVVDRGPVPSREDFDLTTALAGRLGLAGTEQVRWAFAR
jgi:rare lipoprotein A (RlpA)-like double-psi beta-barrel protein